MLFRCSLHFVSIVCLTSFGSASSTWYVDASAVPPGQGTLISPYADIQFAIDRATTLSGDTLLVAPGDYAPFGTKGKSLVIRGEEGPAATRVLQPAMSTAVELDSSFSHLEGFTVLTGGSAVMILGAARVKKCVLSATTLQSRGDGVRVEIAGQDSYVEQSTIAGFNDAVESHPFECPTLHVDSCAFSSNLHDLGSSGGCYAGYASYCAFTKPPVGSGSWILTAPVIHADLGFWAPADFHLAPLSVCIDAGNPAAPPDPNGSVADIGGLPYDPLYAETPTTYCTGKIHSGGCAARIAWSSIPWLSGPDDFTLAANLALNGSAGLFLWSDGPALIPFAGGNLCIAPPMARGPLLFSGGTASGSDCSGAFVWPVSHAYMQAQAWLPGRILYAQCWGRDPGSAYPEKSQLSDAIVFQIVP